MTVRFSLLGMIIIHFLLLPGCMEREDAWIQLNLPNEQLKKVYDAFILLEDDQGEKSAYHFETQKRYPVNIEFESPDNLSEFLDQLVWNDTFYFLGYNSEGQLTMNTTEQNRKQQVFTFENLDTEIEHLHLTGFFEHEGELYVLINPREVLHAIGNEGQQAWERKNVEELENIGLVMDRSANKH